MEKNGRANFRSLSERMKKLIILAIFIFLSFFLLKNVQLDKLTFELAGTRKSLGGIVEKTLENSTGTYSIAIKNLKTGEEYYRDAERIFDTGSLYKLGTMLAVLEGIEKGEINDDEVITGDVEDINKVLGATSEEAEIKEGTVDFTVVSALRQMIGVSHNYAAVLLTQKVGTDKIQEAINRLGLEDTSIDTTDRPKTTVSDMLHFFEKVYKRNGVSAYVSHEMTELLLAQEINDRIPKYLPKVARVAHKTAEIDFQKHDAGIVFTKSGDYIIVVLSESDSPSAAAERIANLSKEVYEYFGRKN